MLLEGASHLDTKYAPYSEPRDATKKQNPHLVYVRVGFIEVVGILDHQYEVILNGLEVDILVTLKGWGRGMSKELGRC